jgi:hypothetical protein
MLKYASRVQKQSGEIKQRRLSDAIQQQKVNTPSVACFVGCCGAKRKRPLLLGREKGGHFLFVLQ